MSPLSLPPRTVLFSAFLLTLLLPAQVLLAQCDGLEGCTLVWLDEFEGDQLDLEQWEPQLGDGTDFGLPPGWGNNELQFYKAENAVVEDGMLKIIAREEEESGYAYTSARLRTLGLGDWTYGRFEMRAKLPIGQGYWPAFWMLSSDPSLYGVWAASGEIDIMEYIGSEPNEIFGTIHYGGSFPLNTFTGNEFVLPEGDFSEDFHVFAIEWEYGEIRWYIDGQLYATQTEWFSTGGPFPAPFDVDFHLLLNLAVGGNLPGAPDDSTVFPQEFAIDYVRVYQVANDPPEVEITSPAQGAVFEPGGPVTITVEASDDDGIASVEFFQDAGKLGQDDSAPYELTIDEPAAGCYTLYASARDSGGVTVTSAPVEIMIGAGCPQAPYLIYPAHLPGSVEVENYDLGGPGVAYSDIDATNNGMRYRPDEGVDIEGTTDAGFGYNVGWTEPGEWIEYTVYVEEAGVYDVEARVASESLGGTIHLEFDGVDKTGPIAFNATGGWQNWSTAVAPGVALEAGVQTMRVAVDQGGFNLNRIDVLVPSGEPQDRVLFDDMEHGNPFGNGWFAFGGEVGGGGIGPNTADLPPDVDGVFSLESGWGSGGTPGFFGGFGRTFPLNLADATAFTFWINPDAGQDFLIEINLQEDDNADGGVPGPPAADDDEFQFNCVVSAEGPCAISGGGWQQVVIPLSDFFDDNSFLSGGNGVLDAVPASAGGNGELINIVWTIVSNSGADASFRTDDWAFATPPPPPPPTLSVFDDFEDGDTSDWGFFGGNAAGGGGGPLDDRPAEGAFYFSTGWGGEGSNSVFYGGMFKNLDNAAQLVMPEDPWFNVWILHQSDATVDGYTLELTIREDTNGNGWTNGEEDSIRLDTVFDRSAFNDEWTILSAPLSDFINLGTGGDGVFNGNLDEMVAVISGVSGGVGSTVEVDFDYFAFTAGGPLQPPCPSGLCFQNGRFEVNVVWETPDGETGIGEPIPASDESGFFWFFGPNNAEIFVKVLDACEMDPFNNFWVFSAALTAVEYGLEVIDTQTGQVYSVHNPQGFVPPAVLGTDTLFEECGDGDGSDLPAMQHVDTSDFPVVEPSVAELHDGEPRTCEADETTVCLQDGRFEVTAQWNDGTDQGDATFAGLTDDSAYAMFFNDTNVELFLKVLDACEIEPFNNYWPFVSGLTHVEVVVTIYDTLTGKRTLIFNEAGQTFPTYLGTDSFFGDCDL